METTCSSCALVGSFPQRNAPIVDHVGKLLTSSVERRAKIGASFRKRV